jgi:chromosome segregation ATPase
MPRWIIERRLVDVSARLKRLRHDLAVAEEQALFLSEEAEDARLRSLVAETPLADAEAREARRHADALLRQRDTLRRNIADLEREQDRLLDQMGSRLDRG